MPTKTLIINGDHIHDIPSFYEEINRVFMGDEDWQIGPSLDALNDMLYGAYGAVQGDETVVLVWKSIEKNRDALGIETTAAFYQEKLKHPEIFDPHRIRKQLDALERGTGSTYFEIVLEVLAEHPNIALQPQ